MKEELQRALEPCVNGQCSFVEIAYRNGDNSTVVLWCRYCGRLEVYDGTTFDYLYPSQQTVNLTPKVFQIVKPYLTK